MTDFRLASRSPDYPELMQFTPEASLAGYGLLVVLEVLGVGAAALGFRRFADDPMTQALVLGGALALGLVLLVVTTRSMLRYHAAPIERVLALVRDESVETTVEQGVHTARNGKRRVSTRERTEYHLLLELEDGERQFSARATTHTDLAPGEERRFAGLNLLFFSCSSFPKARRRRTPRRRETRARRRSRPPSPPRLRC